MQQRLQKIIAWSGIASRRAAEDLIRDGLVTINGQVAKLGDHADPEKDKIKVEGKLLHPEKVRAYYYLMHKPRGVLATINAKDAITKDREQKQVYGLDSKGRRTLDFYIGRIKTRVFPIGRMDFNTEGAILLTNDGDFASKLQKSHSVVRTYRVKVKGAPLAKKMDKLRRGGSVEGILHRPIKLQVRKKYQNKTLIEIQFQGMGQLNIKRLFENKGFLVEKVILHSIGNLSIAHLPSGDLKTVGKFDIAGLMASQTLRSK